MTVDPPSAQVQIAHDYKSSAEFSSSPQGRDTRQPIWICGGSESSEGRRVCRSRDT